ncbi:hypothetical protein C8Q70DRAFT_924560 [Cubamyces menziesii]|uniref:AB hydrolase-1 domain-containing protein n=1 Tax=Trametes cubensis TaxID=1111947 RepID=A0AAD7TSY2_9APHY|nr:hypothetical protein C8Q70DRAFT_924560 [Cubamyces menziesii]KAJ8481409.1 hypothetical protein ONZ51_g6005 [Trametes cubensis]
MASSRSLLHIIEDSGAPKDSSRYVTLVIVHGYAWHGGSFTKMIPFTDKYNARIVLVNRRDYPGSQPYSEDELALLKPVVEGESAEEKTRENLWAYMRDRAAELCALLAILAKEGKILPYDREADTGGAIVAGWSFGSCWLTALLAHGDIASDVQGINLGDYVRRIVLHDPPYGPLGYASPAEPWNPLIDPTIPPENVIVEFAKWVSGYYQHGSTPEELEYRVPLKEPVPTIMRLTEEERDSVLCGGPGSPGGSDDLLHANGLRYGLFKRLKDAAFYPPQPNHGAQAPADTWKDTELRYVWCDRSVWDMPWCCWALHAEIDEAKKSGTQMRPITVSRLRGANHFVHWDEPERALRAFICKAKELET